MESKSLYSIVLGFLLGVLLCSLYEVYYALLLFLMLIATLSLVTYAAFSRKTYLYAALTLFSLIAGVYRTNLTQIVLPAEFELLVDTKVLLTGEVVQAPDIRETSQRLTIHIETGDTETKILAVTFSKKAFRIGDTVSISGVLKKPRPFETDGGREFAYEMFLAKDGIFAVVQPSEVSFIKSGEGTRIAVFRSLEVFARYFNHALEVSLPEPASALASGLIIGGKQGLGKNLVEIFTIAGLIHVVVVSGYNVMIVAEGIMRTLSRFPARLGITLAGVGIILFILIAGAGPPVLRAGIMAMLALVARATGKTYAVLRALFITLMLMVFVNPLILVHDTGLQFSFMATLGIIIGTPIVAKKLLRVKNFALREIIATSIAAQVFVLPILLYQTGNFSLVSLIATVLVMPAIPFAMAFGAIAALGGMIFENTLPLLGMIIGIPAYVLLSYIIKVASFFALLPYAQIIVTTFPFFIVVIVYTLLLMFCARYTEKTFGKKLAPSRGFLT